MRNDNFFCLLMHTLCLICLQTKENSAQWKMVPTGWTRSTRNVSASASYSGYIKLYPRWNHFYLQFVSFRKCAFGVRMVKWTNSKISFQSPGKLSIFHFCPYFHLCSLKSGRHTPIKIIFSKLTRTDLLLPKI